MLSGKQEARLVHSSFWKEYIRQQKEILTLEKQSLESLRSGSGDLYEGKVGSQPMRNITDEAIDRTEAGIRERERLIADYEADHA